MDYINFTTTTYTSLSYTKNNKQHFIHLDPWDSNTFLFLGMYIRRKSDIMVMH